ncbi:MAG: c-type cytochrome [Gammaproteobacteria bacterium]|nr:c-type cytochrome [Gammaproteobacteria bacterium]
MNKRMLGISIFSMAVAVVSFALVDEARSEPPGAAKMCQGCHGQDGVSSKDTVPSIAGISAFVHADYLYAYRDGARTCTDPKTKAMCTMTAKLTDEQIEELAEYFAGMLYRPAEQDFDADKAAMGAAIHDEKCGKCHTDGGSNPDDDASILAGQWLPYMKLSLSQFASDEREQPGAMQRKIVGLSEADVEALAHYYASQQ